MDCGVPPANPSATRTKTAKAIQYERFGTFGTIKTIPPISVQFSCCAGVVLFFNEDDMNRSRLLFVACITLSFTISFVVAAAAFRATAPSVLRVGTVTPAAPMLEPRSGQTATLLPDGKVLIAGGMRRNQDFYRSAELYDPATGKFQPTGEMAERRVGHIAVLLRSGKVLIAGGWVGQGATDSAELYDPTTGKFAAIAKLTARR